MYVCNSNNKDDDDNNNAAYSAMLNIAETVFICAAAMMTEADIIFSLCVSAQKKLKNTDQKLL